jgi:hypothetical protein
LSSLARFSAAALVGNMSLAWAWGAKVQREDRQRRDQAECRDRWFHGFEMEMTEQVVSEK